MHVLTVIRTYLGLSQVALAKSAGITQADLSEIETKAPYGKISKYQRLSNHLGIPVEAIAKNDFTHIPESFFEKHPAPTYLPLPKSPELLLGRDGEEYIFRREQERLTESHPALSKLVLPYFKLKAPSPGYDILSFDDTGHPVFLEVKTSVYDTRCFRLTNHELDVAQKLSAAGERYSICYISNWGTEEQRVQDFVFAELNQTHRISPCYYMCKPHPKKKSSVTGLAYFRKMRGLLQAEVSEALGIPSYEWSLYETGRRTPLIKQYLRISEVLDATLDQLLAHYDVEETSHE